jgi:phage tail tube protein FII
MPNGVWTMEAANLFCGSDYTNSADSNHLILSELKLPSMDVQFSDFRSGGGPITLEIPTVEARLEVTFVLLGVTPQIMGLVNSWASSNSDFFAYGVIRDQISGQAAQAAAYMTGMIGRADPQNYRKGDVMHTNYSIRGIDHYELYVAGIQIYLWDYAANYRWVGGADQNALINQFLHTGTSSPPSVLGGSIGWQNEDPSTMEGETSISDRGIGVGGTAAAPGLGSTSPGTTV